MNFWKVENIPNICVSEAITLCLVLIDTVSYNFRHIYDLSSMMPSKRVLNDLLPMETKFVEWYQILYQGHLIIENVKSL